MNPTVPTLDELIESASSPYAYLSGLYAAGWLVRHTLVPAWAKTYVAAAVVLAPVVGAVLLARVAGVLLERGQCRARTSTGDRCSRDAEHVGGDLCWQHGDLADVELVDDDGRKNI